MRKGRRERNEDENEGKRVNGCMVKERQGRYVAERRRMVQLVDMISGDCVLPPRRAASPAVGLLTRPPAVTGRFPIEADARLE